VVNVLCVCWNAPPALSLPAVSGTQGLIGMVDTVTVSVGRPSSCFGIQLSAVDTIQTACKMLVRRHCAHKDALVHTCPALAEAPGHWCRLGPLIPEKARRQCAER
jgi:hypothetical protein